MQTVSLFIPFPLREKKNYFISELYEGLYCCHIALRRRNRAEQKTSKTTTTKSNK